MIKNLRPVLGGLSLSLMLAISAFAQANSRVSGTVTDSTGAVVSGAKVTATNEATGVSHTQSTTEAGLYSFPSLPVGSYSVKVEMSGFKTANKTGIVIQVNTPVTADITLEIGQANEVVNVEGG